MDCVPKQRFCSTVLPTIYRDALTYEEQMRTLICAMQNLEETVNNLQDISNTYTDQQIILSDGRTDVKIANAVKSVTESFNAAITTVYETMSVLDDAVRVDLINQIEGVKKQIDDIMLGDLYVYDPTMGYDRLLTDVINSIYSVARIYAILAGDYDPLKLTAKGYDDLGLTAREFDIFGKQKLMKDPNHYMSNPVTGGYDVLQTVISDLYNLKKTNSVTAGVFDALKWSASAYDGKDITAYDYDWDFNSLFFGANYCTENNVILQGGAKNVFKDGNTTVFSSDTAANNTYLIGYQIPTKNMNGKKIKANFWGVPGVTCEMNIGTATFGNVDVLHGQDFVATIFQDETPVFLKIKKTLSTPFNLAMTCFVVIEE